MTERSIVEAADRLRRHGEPYLVATVVAVSGAAYRRPGARMILTRFRWVAGTVSGGCLEGDIAEHGWWRTRDGHPVLITYDATTSVDNDDDIRSAFGLGCDGVVEVLLERAGVAGRIDALDFASRCLRAQRRGAIATVFHTPDPALLGARLAIVAGEALEGAGAFPPALRDAIETDLCDVIERGESVSRRYGDVDALIEAVLPPARLYLFGTGHDAVPVAQLARSIGWDVTVCASEAKHSTRERFHMTDDVLVGSPDDIAARIAAGDRAVALVMTHNSARDREALRVLLATRLRYVGVLGPRSRTQRLLREIGADDEDPRVVAPVGLPIGAETPHELALAIIAEMQAVLAGTPIADVRPPPHRAVGSAGIAAVARAAR